MEIQFYKNGKLCQDKILGKGFLDFSFGSKFGRFMYRIMSMRWASRIMGWLAKTRLSKRSIKNFVKKFDINLSDFIQPIRGYSSFNDFFIRALRPGARTIDQDESVVVSPADGKLFIINNISQDQSFIIKNNNFSLERFLGDKQRAQEYEHGCLMIFRLSPYDYHRYHFPVAATPQKPIEINGVLGSVNPWVYHAKRQPLVENQRSLIMLSTKEFGQVASVAVGALFVGSIYHTFAPAKLNAKGSEMGFFSYGGSTLVLLFKQNVIKPLPEFLEHSQQGFETAVVMGQKVAAKI